MRDTHEDLYLLAEKTWSEADEKIIKLDAIEVVYQALLAERERGNERAWAVWGEALHAVRSKP